MKYEILLYSVHICVLSESTLRQLIYLKLTYFVHVIKIATQIIFCICHYKSVIFGYVLYLWMTFYPRGYNDQKHEIRLIPH
jgi:hypothetical protein